MDGPGSLLSSFVGDGGDEVAAVPGPMRRKSSQDEVVPDKDTAFV